MASADTDRQTAILTALVEGNSIRATARMVGVSKNTVSRLLRIAGEYALRHHDEAVRDVDSKRVQCDEIWSFVGCKERNVAKNEKGKGRSDVWTWTALDQDSKLMVSYRVGNRDAETALAFMDDLRDRISKRFQLTTDGLNIYLRAVETAFGLATIDYAMLVKIYGASPDTSAARRYSPAECIGAEKKAVMGAPKDADFCTSHVERNNLTMRMGMRRFTRLTNAFSKKVEFHLCAVALHAMFYNFCRPHQTLTRANRGIRTTPAMAAGLTDRPWTVAAIAAGADTYAN